MSGDESTTTTRTTTSTTTTPPPAIMFNTNNNNNDTYIGDLTDTTTVVSSNSNLLTELTNGFTNSIGNLINDLTHKRCKEWQQPHHIYFHLAYALFLIAFLTPNGSYGALCTRCALVLASIFLIMWSYLIECSFDALVWSSSFLCINFVYLIILIYRMKPIRFDNEIDAVYGTLFKPLHVSRHQFRKILNCMKMIRSLKYQEVYAQEKVTKVDSLSLVLSGKLVVSQNQRALHIVFPHQFLDSPEWFGVSTDDYFQVSIMAMEDSRVLIWHRDKLRLSIIGEPFLQTVFDHILGKDVVKKLMQVTQVNETMSNSNGHLQSLDENGFDDKPMLQSKMNGNDDQGITALINCQLQDEHVPLLGRQQTKPYMLQKQSAFCTNYRLNNDYKTSPC